MQKARFLKEVVYYASNDPEGRNCVMMLEKEVVCMPSAGQMIRVRGEFEEVVQILADVDSGITCVQLAQMYVQKGDYEGVVEKHRAVGWKEVRLNGSEWTYVNRRGMQGVFFPHDASIPAATRVEVKGSVGEEAGKTQFISDTDVTRALRESLTGKQGDRKPEGGAPCKE